MTPEELCQIEEIRQLKYRYVRAIDTHDWDLMATCFTEDAVFEPNSGAYQEVGGEAIVRFFENLVGPSFISSHVVTHPEIELTSETTAHGRWRLEDVVHFTDANPAVKSVDVKRPQVLDGAAYYYDEYSRGEGWRISYLTFVRIFRTVSDRGDEVELAVDDHLGANPGWPRQRPAGAHP